MVPSRQGVFAVQGSTNAAGAGMRRSGERVADMPTGGDGQSRLGHCWPGDVATKPFELTALIGSGGNSSVQ